MCQGTGGRITGFPLLLPSNAPHGSDTRQHISTGYVRLPTDPERAEPATSRTPEPNADRESLIDVAGLGPRYGSVLLVAVALTGCAHTTIATTGLVRGEYGGPCGPGLPGEKMGGKADVTQSGQVVRTIAVSAGKSFQVELSPGTYKIILPHDGYYITTVEAGKTTTLALRACT
jgi:hypothetical protein